MPFETDIRNNTEILVVDDEHSIREVLRLRLSDEDYAVEVAENGRRAIELLEQKSFDLVVSDIKMPGLGGMGLLKHIRTNYPATDVVIMTGYASMENAIESMREGAVDYIIKPFNIDDMVFIVQRALKKRNLEETESLFEFSRKIFSTIDFDQLLKIILDATFKAIHPDDVSLMLPNEDRNLYIAVSYGLNKDIIANTKVPIGKQISGRVAQNKKPIILNGPANEKDGFEGFIERKDISSAIIYPLVWNNNLLGVLNLSRTVQKEKFTPKQMMKIGIYASLLCQALENANLHARSSRLVKELTKTKEELTIAKEHLDKKVQERTQELSEAKNRLEDYSRSLEQKAMEISTLYNLSRRIINIQQFDALVRTADEIVRRIINFRVLVCCIDYEGRRETWITTDIATISNEQKQKFEARLAEEIIREMGTNETLATNSFNWLDAATAGKLQHPWPDEAEIFQNKTVAGLFLHGAPVGFMALYRLVSEEFSERDTNLFSMLCSNISLAIGNAYSFRKLQETDEIRSEFVSTVSHELKTPLTCIGQSINMLKNGTVGPITDIQKECLTIATEEVSRLERLIRNVLDISKMNAGKMDLKLSPVSIPEILRKATSILAPRLNEKEVSLESDVPDISIPADADALLQILLNLIDNATKFSPKKGTVTVSVEEKDDSAVFRVKDEGPGISQQNQKFLFEKFVQILGRENRPTGGSGLGLFISKHLVELHQGTIRVESAEGEGSTFIFTIPTDKI